MFCWRRGGEKQMLGGSKRPVNRGAGSKRCRLDVEELEPRVVMDGAAGTPDAPVVNRPVTTDAAVQQMPSVAVDPLNASHLVVAYMDYNYRDRAGVKTGYAGID